MNDVVADTHAILWYLFTSSKLTTAARDALAAADATGRIVVSAITLVEVCYLVEKGRFAQSVLDNLRAATADPSRRIQIAPVDAAVADALPRIPRGIVPDMPDRIIAATGYALRLPVVSCDAKVRAAPIRVIW